MHVARLVAQEFLLLRSLSDGWLELVSARRANLASCCREVTWNRIVMYVIAGHKLGPCRSSIAAK